MSRSVQMAVVAFAILVPIAIALKGDTEPIQAASISSAGKLVVSAVTLGLLFGCLGGVSHFIRLHSDRDIESELRFLVYVFGFIAYGGLSLTMSLVYNSNYPLALRQYHFGALCAGWGVGMWLSFRVLSKQKSQTSGNGDIHE